MGEEASVRNQLAGGSGGHIVQAGTIQHVSLTGTPMPGTGRGDGPPRQLPLAVRDFIGRAEYLAALDALLTDDKAGDDTSAAVVIWAVDGTAGIGKTTLAVHWAHRVQHCFPDGTLHTNLRGYGPGQPATPGEALDGFLRALGVSAERIPVDLEARAAFFRSVLADRRVLIVLDNANSADQIRPLLPGAPGCVVVVTSRDSLTGLVVTESARRLTLDLLTEHEALHLVSGIIGPDRAAAEPEAVVELVRLCARLPLALRIAAARAATHPHDGVARVVTELADDNGPLDVLSRSADQRTAVRAVFDWSYHRLPAEHARLFRRLGQHPSPDINPDAAAALAERDPTATRRLLEDLADTHLIEPTARGRYRFHDLLRAYAVDQADQHDSSTDRDQAMEALLTWYVHAAVTCDTAAYPAHSRLPRQPAVPAHPVTINDRTRALAWFEMERDNLLALLQHAANHDLHHHVLLLTDSVRFLGIDYRWDEALEALNTGLVAARRCGDRAAEIWFLQWRGEVLSSAERWVQARDSFDQALAANAERGDWSGTGRILSALGRLYLFQERFEEAKPLLVEALPLCRGTDSGRMESVAEGNLSEACAGLGDDREALDHAERGLALRRQCGDLAGEAYALDRVARAWQGLGEHTRAIAFAREANAVGRATGAPTGTIAATLDTLAISLHGTGCVAEAVQCWQEAITLFDDRGYPYQAAEATRIRERLRVANAAAQTCGDVRAHEQR